MPITTFSSINKSKKSYPVEYNDLSTIYSSKRPWGIYDVALWDSINNVIPEARGNGRNVISAGTITKSVGSGNGATGNISYLSGTTTSKLTWPTGSIPSSFTICSISRYTGTTNARIITTTGGNWLHGHWNGSRGVCYYEGWKTNTTTVGTLTNWLVCCGKNSASTPGNILIDGVASGTATGGTGGSGYCLTIGNGWTGELSTWALSYVIIWDQLLTDAEMLTVSKALTKYLQCGISLPIPSAPLTSVPTNLSGLYSIKLVNNLYFGPIFNIVRSSDSASSDFYTNCVGLKYTTGYNNTGTSIISWLGSSTIAYVSIWYDQSGKGNNATQTTPASRPYFNWLNNYIYFPSNCFLNLPNGTVPYNTSYTVFAQHCQIANTAGGLIGSGVNGSTNRTNNFRRNNAAYVNYWWGNDYGSGTYLFNNKLTWIYNTSTTTTTLYQNEVAQTGQNRTGWNGQASNNFIGKTTNNEYLTGHLINVALYKSVLTSNERLQLEGLSIVKYNINNANLLYYYPLDSNFYSYTSDTLSNLATVGTGTTIISTNSRINNGCANLPAVSTQKIQIPSFTFGTGGITIAGWLKWNTSTQGTWSRFFDFGSNPGGTYNFGLAWPSSTQFMGFIYNPSSGTATGGVASTYTGGSDMQWHHICLTIAAQGTNTWSLYVDNVAYTLSVSAYPATVSLPSCLFGKSNWGSDANINANFNSIVIFNRVLTATERGYLYNYPNNIVFTSDATS